MVSELSLAPMMKVTTPEFRLLIRTLSPAAVLFTEMIAAPTALWATEQKLRRLLGEIDPKTVVQIGGSDPAEVAAGVSRMQQLGWTAFNLNCGCPSDRVQSGSFGAVLMLDKSKVADIVNEVYRATGVVLSLKIRTGVDEHDSYDFFEDFVLHVSRNTPCQTFYVHARKCWLKGLSPKENRTIPQLNYEFVHRLKSRHPRLSIHLNGGIAGPSGTDHSSLDGLMIGRHAVKNPTVFNEYAGETVPIADVLDRYLNRAIDLGYPFSRVLIPLNNIRRGSSMNKIFRRTLNDLIHNSPSLEDVLTRLRPFFSGTP